MATAKARTRLIAIDALRGLVMLFMLVDHVRETFFLYMQVSDPVDANVTDPGLFYTRLLSTFCAPTFVALTGLSAWLYGQSHSKGQVSEFLLKRGLFLIVLEFTVVGYAWPTQAPAFPPTAIWLQVIWAIGISMIALAALLHLPRVAQFAVGLGIVCLHNLLDPIRLTADQPGYDLAADVLVPFQFWDTSNGRVLEVRNPEDIADLDPDEDQDGDATIVSITGRDTTTGYWEVRLHPIPSSASDTIKYRYRAFITEFTSAMDATDMAPKYPAWLQNALLWGTCAMIKEEKENATATVEWEKYTASINFGSGLNKEQSVPASISMGRADRASSFRFDMEIVPD